MTSGYEPFMKGLVKEYMKSFHKNCTWRTIGSTIKFSNGCIYLKEVMTQEKKFQFVKKIIDYGNRVVFLADDSVEEKELFSVVFRNGGYAFNVRYDEKLHESNWHELINDIEDENVFLSYLMKNSEVALSDCKKVQNNFFRLHMNEIGVICLNDIEYQIFLGSFNRDKKIVEYIKKVSHKKEEKYYLRGRYYYYWLPSYITGSLESKYAGWKKIVIDGIDIIEHIARYNIKENKYACILSYVICDHLLSVLYLAMYCAEEDVLDRERNVISSYRHIENSVCILNKILFSVFDNKIEYSNLDSLVKELKSISFEDMDIIRENEKFLLELDNYNTIYEAVYNIIDNLKVKAQKIDKVIYFAYGGISLGYGVMPILIIENKLSVEDIMKVINIYGLNVFKCGIQMQFRTNIEYINKIIEMGFERVIVAVGLMQKDVKEYLEFVDKALRTSKDLILLDMSRHQPHVIVNEKVIDKYDVSFETKYNCLNRIVSCLKKLETSVLLADDIMPDKMILCQLMLLSQGVNIIGLDMQNNIEVDKTEQKYCKIKENKTSKYHYAKIRKSVEKIKKWNIFE